MRRIGDYLIIVGAAGLVGTAASVVLRLAVLCLLSAGCIEKAPPMQGECTPVLAKSYTGGDADGPQLSCLWSGRRWECERHGAGSSKYWRCTDVGPAPAEAPR